MIYLIFIVALSSPSYNRDVMNIHENWEKIKSGRAGEYIFIITLILLVGLAAYLLGRISVLPQNKNIPYVNITTPDGTFLHC